MRESIEMGWDERTVTVNRLKLLETLRVNREKHGAEYLQSLAGYKSLASAELEKQFSRAMQTVGENKRMLQTKIDNFDPDDPLQNQVVLIGQIGFTLRVPEDHTRSYDVAIQMAEWEVGDTIALTQSQFQCFVMDDWDWKKDFVLLNKTYSR